MRAPGGAINNCRFVPSPYFYAALAALILVFPNLPKQIPCMTAAGGTINHSRTFGCINKFSAFPAMIYIFASNAEIDPIMTSPGRTIQNIGAGLFFDQNITFSAQINMENLCGKSVYAECKNHKEIHLFHFIFLLTIFCI